jgi:excisionase family DNA binding protein
LPEVYLTTTEVADILKVSVPTVISYCRHGGLGHTKVQRQYRIPVADLEEFVARDSVAADARRMLDASIAEGRLPAEPPPEVLGRIAEILRQHNAEQAAS